MWESRKILYTITTLDKECKGDSPQTQSLVNASKERIEHLKLMSMARTALLRIDSQVQPKFRKAKLKEEMKRLELLESLKE
jgi:hypothetical protein